MSRASCLSVALTLAACGNDTNRGHVLEPPVVAITDPAEGAVFHQGSAPIPLAGTVHDSFDSPADLVVTGNVDGDTAIAVEVTNDGEATGAIDATTLTVGKHVARLQAVDTDASTAFVHVGFTVVGPLGPPVVEITEPAAEIEIEIGASITFRGEASDLATPAPSLVFAWSSDLDGALGGVTDLAGGSVLTTDALSVGAHVVTLAVTDGDGEVGEAAVTVTVVEPTLPPLVYDAFLDFDTDDNGPTRAWQYGTAASPGGELSLYTVPLVTRPDLDPKGVVNGVCGWTDERADDYPEVAINTTDEEFAHLDSFGDGVYFPSTDFLQVHPDRYTDTLYSVVRFVAPEAGDWTIDCAFKSLSVGIPPSTDVHVLVAGVEVFEAIVGGEYDPDPSAGLAYEDVVTLAAGDTVDFAVGPGPGADYTYDSTGFRAAVTRY